MRSNNASFYVQMAHECVSSQIQPIVIAPAQVSGLDVPEGYGTLMLRLRQLIFVSQSMCKKTSSRLLYCEKFMNEKEHLLHVEQLNQQASDAKEESYVDPGSGYLVFSSYGLLKRGQCCGSACRHCPYEYERVPLHERSKLFPRSLSSTATQRVKKAQ